MLSIIKKKHCRWVLSKILPVDTFLEKSIATQIYTLNGSGKYGTNNKCFPCNRYSQCLLLSNPTNPTHNIIKK